MDEPNPMASAPAASRVEPVTVLYVMGAPRCGSTVLDNILNEVDNFFSAGELRFLWQRMDQGRFCGCGRSFESCEVWAPVLEKVAAPDPSRRLSPAGPFWAAGAGGRIEQPVDPVVALLVDALCPPPLSRREP